VFVPPVNHEASLSHLLSAQAQMRYLHAVAAKFVVADLNCVVDALMSTVAEPISLTDTLCVGRFSRESCVPAFF
jgi:hypothetical protein